jgi:hypothetical protein
MKGSPMSEKVEVVEHGGVKCVRTLTLARIEAAYGPILVVVVLDDDDVRPERTKADYEQWARMSIDSIDPPSDVFRRVVAVFKEGVNEPMNQFTSLRSRVVPADFDFEALSRARGAEKWAAFFGGMEEEPTEPFPKKPTGKRKRSDG